MIITSARQAWSRIGCDWVKCHSLPGYTSDGNSPDLGVMTGEPAWRLQLTATASVNPKQMEVCIPISMLIIQA